MSGTPTPGLVSVVVPCVDRLDSAAADCLVALARHTRPPWELVAVDDGSADGTAAYLAGIRDAAPFPVTVVANATPLGVAAAREQGLAAARGETLVLLDGAAVVTDAWLDQLLALARADPAIGMVGPMSNVAGPAQRVADVPYTDLEGMHRFATRWRQEHRGTWSRAESLSGPCVLIPHRVLDAVGGPGPGGADGLASRVRRAGLTPVVARDLFVHHPGRRSPDASAPPGVAARRQTRLKVFGVGLPRTGTTSLAAAMLELGFRTCHSCFDDALFDRGEAFFDTPVYVDYPQLDRRYPGSRFILTWREPAEWYASFARSLGPYLHRLRTARALPGYSLVDRRCYLQMFGAEGLSEGPFIDRYREHRRRVEEHFRDRPGDLVVLELAALEDPWGEICRFLGAPRPTSPFPRHNARSIDYWLQLRHENKL